MIIGIGIDIIDNERVKKIAEEYGDDLLSRLFTEREIEYCNAKKSPEINFGARFAAKEALLKALGTGLRGEIHWKEIEVIHDSMGKPSIKLDGTAAKSADELGVRRANLSLSHTKDYAVAVVILEGN